MDQRHQLRQLLAELRRWLCGLPASVAVDHRKVADFLERLDEIERSEADARRRARARVVAMMARLR